MSSSRSSSSVVNTPGGEAVSSMSYYNDAASELARKLNLGDRGSPTDEMRTRLQAQRESQHKSASSRAPAKSSTSRGKGKGKAPAEPTRKQPRRESTRRARDPSPSDSDDDDEDDDDADDSDDGDDPPAPETPGLSTQDAKRLTILAIMSAFEPSREETDPSLHLSPYEFSYPEQNSRLPESSRAYRSLVLAQVEVTRTEADFARIANSVPLNGTFWGQRTARDLENRVQNALRYFSGELTPQRDALDTIGEFRRVFTAVENIFKTWPLYLMHPDSKIAAVATLANTLDLIAYKTDPPPRAGSGALVYAGPTSEWNLFLRFASARSDWMACLEILRRLMAANSGALFNERARVSLRNANQRMETYRASGGKMTQGAVDYVEWFKLVVRSLPGII